MDNVIIFADHSIGYALSEYLIKYSMKNPYHIISIFSNKNNNAWWPNVKDLANEANIEFYYYDEKETINYLASISCDYLLLLSWKHIIPEQVITKINKSVLNLHYSLLPKHRGVYPVNFALQNSDKTTGITYHLVNSNIDQGDIILQKQTEILITDDAKSLLLRLDSLAFDAFKEIWEIRNSWKENAKPQIGNITYNSRKKYNLTNLLDLNKTYKSLELINLIQSKKFGENSSLYFTQNNI